MVEERARVARDLARRAIGVQSATVDADAPFDAVLGAALGALAVEAERAGVRIDLRSTPTARVAGATSVSHILTNLVLNALAHAPRGSSITVDASVANGRFVVDVGDAGPGVDAARAESIFDGDSTRPGGAGVGLRHARSVARAAGGNLELATEGVVSGARFRLTWPRAGGSVPPPPMSAPRQRLLVGKRVLILEDDSDVATLLETALGARGAKVTVATTADELALAAVNRHDAALIDLSPIADDVQGAIDRVRAGSPDAEVVLISGSAVGIPDALAEGRVRWVRKPFEVGEVVAALTDPKK
jgi:CheY-like chemotaxis protein